jgi:hypothetical protein
MIDDIEDLRARLDELTARIDMLEGHIEAQTIIARALADMHGGVR